MFGKTFILAWILSKLSQPEKPPEKKREAAVDFGLEYSTPKGRRIGFIVFLAALVAAVICVFIHHPLFAIIAGFIALCGLVWPFLYAGNKPK
jgi:hypothetical protein